MTLKETALHAEHAALGASFTDFGGWDMPLKYSSELAEHHAVRRAAGLFDLSHMGEIWVRGPQAAAFLDYALVGNLSAIPVGKAKYSLICTPEGGIIDDLISYRRPATAEGDEVYLVVPNAGNADAVYAEFVARAAAGAEGGFDVELLNASASTSLIALQGPEAERILLTLVPAEQAADVRELKYYAATEVEVAGLPVLLARTGYTGEDGFELYIDNAQAPQLWNALLNADEAVIPCGLASRDSLRLEAAMPLYGNELGLNGNPFEAGLGPVVSLAPAKTAKEGDFVGKAALAHIKADRAEHPVGTRVLVGLQGQGRRAARSHYPVLAAGEQIGEVTSGLPSPTLGYPVALAYVSQEYSQPGTELQVDLRGKTEPFTVVSLPFYTRSR
ncbi:glycine cleavage system aminomethyltransferase GcvT [Psychromicrobium xiongbiense]|uniref:glycine cleavage system aminomethyltransferase GcvT n=1 Tax=Psychromicrobium xiongbiense TaxID=3051184 RepID=UPI002556A719|nr:glycine cleavage system aminomethyltransferase GcvT [Psychromicrobium sp. YIM S02556]